MVTKQQQINYLAKLWDRWLIDDDYVVMSGSVIGSSGGQYVITRQEWQQERDKMSSKPEVDNSWYERGELPPVGCECEIKHKCWVGFQRVTVAATTNEYAIIEDDSVVAREQHYHLRDVTFRPISTEREKAIDEMVKTFEPHYGSVAVANKHAGIAEMLYDAGYRKVKP